MKSCHGAQKLERRTVEKNWRTHMKNLIFNLSSHIPNDHNFSKDTLTQHEYLDQTASYIKHMKGKIDRLKQMKAAGVSDQINNQDKSSGLKLPMVEVRHMDSSLEVVLISCHDKSFVFHEVVSVLEEEGAEVVNASFTVAANQIFHTIHCQGFCSTIGLDTSIIYDRLRKMIP